MKDDTTKQPFEERHNTFRGIAKRVQIISNNLGFGPKPMPDEEVEERLTVTADGRVFFTAYLFGDGKSLVKSESRRLRIAPENAAQILNEVGQFFAEEASIQVATDIGTWTMSLTNSAGEKFASSGPMPCSDEALIHLSSKIRAELDMPGLYIFDGAAFEDRIEKVTIDYRRVTTIKLDDPTDPDTEELKWVYSEKILLDRDTETLAYIQIFGPRCRVVRSYYVDPGVSEFLDDHHSTRLFSQTKGNPPDAVDDLSDFKDYIITVEYRDADPLVVFGTFDKNGLPEDFSEWAEDIRKFMAYYGMGEIIHPLVFGKARRRESDYIFCSVVFQDSEKSYYYLTDDATLDVGDQVIVPVGSAGGTAIVEIEDIEYFSKEEVPFPLEKIKRIIRKYDRDDEGESRE